MQRGDRRDREQTGGHEPRVDGRAGDLGRADEGQADEAGDQREPEPGAPDDVDAARPARASPSRRDAAQASVSAMMPIGMFR